MKAFNDMILLEVDEELLETKEGIQLTEKTSEAWIGPIAKVLDVGPIALDNTKPPIKKGDTVLIDPRYVTNTMVKGKPCRYTRPAGLVGKLSQNEINAEIVPIEKAVDPVIVPPTKPKIEIVN